MLVRPLLVLCALLAPSAALRAAQTPAESAPAAPAPSQHPPVFELVESAPIETTLDHADIRNADVVWVEMIQGATRSIDLAHFYASDAPQSRLEPVLVALESAGSRGVDVRFLVDIKFTSTYPDVIGRLKGVQGMQLRVIDYSSVSRGVMHAKYMLVDGEEVYFGSQNFDWRSLEHIQELGVRVAQADVAAAFQDIFTYDWLFADGRREESLALKPQGYVFPARIGKGETEVKVTPVFSPKPLLPKPELWELLEIVKLIDNARESVRLQVMTYRLIGQEKAYFDTLDAALRRAAARGVKVEILCADWAKRKGMIEALQSLVPLENVDVRLTTIPEWSGGFIPYARVSHAKYLVVDKRRGWIGTSNFERDYFSSSRNVGLIVEGKQVGEQLERYFATGWNSSYAKPVDPSAQYEAPRIAD